MLNEQDLDLLTTEQVKAMLAALVPNADENLRKLLLDELEFRKEHTRRA